MKASRRRFVSTALGGGLDINGHEKVAIRVAQVDWISIHTDEGWKGNTIRFGFGVVFRAGKQMQNLIRFQEDIRGPIISVQVPALSLAFITNGELNSKLLRLNISG